MSSYINYLASDKAHGYFWEKYRPAILKLMVSSAEGSQEYKFSGHEVKAANSKQKSSFVFTLTFHKSKAINDIRSSAIAKDLLRVLQQSGKAAELSGLAEYEFRFDKHFVLHVSKRDVPLEITQELQDSITEPIAG
jgi:hypothetical protein